jgi:hypothetical protein
MKNSQQRIKFEKKKKKKKMMKKFFLKFCCAVQASTFEAPS